MNRFLTRWQFTKLLEQLIAAITEMSIAYKEHGVNHTKYRESFKGVMRAKINITEAVFPPSSFDKMDSEINDSVLINSGEDMYDLVKRMNAELMDCIKRNDMNKAVRKRNNRRFGEQSRIIIKPLVQEQTLEHFLSANDLTLNVNEISSNNWVAEIKDAVYSNDTITYVPGRIIGEGITADDAITIFVRRVAGTTLSIEFPFAGWDPKKIEVPHYLKYYRPPKNVEY